MSQGQAVDDRIRLHAGKVFMGRFDMYDDIRFRQLVLHNPFYGLRHVMGHVHVQFRRGLHIQFHENARPPSRRRMRLTG